MTMNEDIKKYKRYIFYDNKLLEADWITSTQSYNHYAWQLHHYIKQQDYERNKAWYDDRGIMQKLILLPIYLHEQVHLQAVKNLTDKEFKDKYKISRWKLLFNRRHSEY